jgi:zinc D-Ala-D-Ala carboxypeptidase
MDNISKHITLHEATHSPTGAARGIRNLPTEEHLENMKLLAEKVFEPLRNWYGKPIKINSFYRSKALNEAIGGSKTSQHSFGQAMDIDTSSDNKKLFDYIRENLEWDQMIWEFGNDENPDWVHVSYKSSGNRREILKAIKVKGVTKYVKF